MTAAESAVGAIIGDPDYRMSLGAVNTLVDADVRRFPLDFSLGLAPWLTFTANVPIVVTRVNTGILVDSANAEAGWNQASFESGNAGGAGIITLLLGQLENAAATLEAGIAAGSYGCPSPTCDQARSLVVRSRSLRVSLATLSGVGATGPLPPLAPLATSAAGTRLRDEIDLLGADLAAFGVGGVSGSGFPLPTTRIGGPDIRTLLSSTGLGYGATVPAYSKRPNVGDIELGMRLGLAQTAGFRAVLSGTARLPTGIRDSPDNLVDIGTGDRQTDLVAAIEVVLDPGPVSLALGASYTLQLPNNFARRVTPPDQPVALASTLALVKRDLGDMIWFSADPALQLTPGFRLYGSFTYFRKGSDRYDAADGTGTNPAILGEMSAMRSLSVGGGIAYRVAGTVTSPVEAGVSYRTAVSGSGGFAPKTTVISMFLRASYRLW